MLIRYNRFQNFLLNTDGRQLSITKYNSFLSNIHIISKLSYPRKYPVFRNRIDVACLQKNITNQVINFIFFKSTVDQQSLIFMTAKTFAMLPFSY